MSETNLETVGNSSLGNIKTKEERIVPSKYWVFTFNNYEEKDLEILETTFRLFKIKYIFGREIAPTTGTPHLQGYIESETKIRPIEKLKLDKRIFWQKRAKNATQEDNINYCSKGSDIRTNFKILKDPLKGKELYPFQKQIIDICNDYCENDRVIHVYIDKGGCKGKTTLAKHICMNYDAIYLSGKCSDCKAAIMSMKHKPDICIFDFVRSVEDYVSYEAIEAVKNGIFFSGKYESNMCMYNPPHVFVFTNFDLEYDKLTKDRWVINYL